VTGPPGAATGRPGPDGPTLYVTGDADADRLLCEDPFALLLGMLLDQQVPLEWAFAGPHRLRERLGELSPAAVAGLTPERLGAVFAERPALHRFPAAMARRAHALAVRLVEDYDGRADALWEDVDDAAELVGRLRALPGFGAEKAAIFVALLGKRFGVRPRGWAEAATPFADAEPRSIADCGSHEELAAVRAWKRSMRAAGRSKADPPP
jgi:uncharacterized HhH-GPD family protein